jgi:hypothetical protein
MIARMIAISVAVAVVYSLPLWALVPIGYWIVCH